MFGYYNGQKQKLLPMSTEGLRIMKAQEGTKDKGSGQSPTKQSFCTNQWGLAALIEQQTRLFESDQIARRLQRVIVTWNLYLLTILQDSKVKFCFCRRRCAKRLKREKKAWVDQELEYSLQQMVWFFERIGTCWQEWPSQESVWGKDRKLCLSHGPRMYFCSEGCKS